MNGMMILYAATAVALAASCIGGRQRTMAALKLAAVRLGKILPAFLVMIVLLAVALTLMPGDKVRALLDRGNLAWGVAVAALVGSITLMPGFIAFPLSGALLKQGVPYTVLAAFTTTLMMVGVLTYPLERHYFGRNVTILRNAVSLAIALAVAVVMGLVFGEIAL